MITASNTQDEGIERASDYNLEGLLDALSYSSLSPEEKDLIYAEIMQWDMNIDRYEELSKRIYESQIDPINSGRNYDMRDIQRKIAKEIL